MPQGQAGLAAAALVKIREAAEAINKALPSVPMGTEFYTKISKIATDFNKLLLDAPNDPGVQAVSHVQGARDLSRTAPAQALARMYPAPAQPAMPPGGGAPPAPPAAAA